MKVMAKKIRQAYSAESAPNKCASALTSLLAEPGLKAHVEFISAFHETWWNRHFKWLQSTDDLTKLPGFESHHIAVRFFVMSSSLRKLLVGLSTDPAFQGYRDAKALMTNADELAHLDKVEQHFF